MALTPEQIELLTEKYITDLYAQLEREVIGDISRRLRKAERFTETAELQAKFMTEQGFSAVKIRNEVMKNLNADPEYQKFLAENTKEYKAFVKEEIAQTVKEAQKAGNKLVAEAGTMAWNDDLQMWAEHGVDLSKPSSLSQIMTAFRKQTVNELKNITRTTGFKGTALGTTGVMNAFQKEMDMAVLKTVTGTFSYQKATNDCIKAIAQSGLRSIDYASGRSMNLDTAARMIVRTSCSQLAGKITEANMDATGTELVYVSAHDGARPEHAEWQGKVYTYSGEPTREYPDFVESTGYGDVDGLKGVNCTHNFYPYWEGASVIPEYTPAEPVEIDGKEYTMYEATQEQRKMERQIRELKRERQAQIDSGKPDAAVVDKLNSKIKLKTDEYKRFSTETGLRIKSDRLAVTGNSGVVSKAIAPKKEETPTIAKIIESKAKSDTIKIDESIEFDNATKQDYSRLYKSHSKNITKEEAAQIAAHETPDGYHGGYVATHNYATINSNMRNDGFIKKALHPDDEKTIEAMRTVISKNELDKDLYLTRYVNADYLTSMFGVKFNPYGKGEETISNSIVNAANFKKHIPGVVEGLQGKVGEIITEKAFVSTSLMGEKNIMQDKPVMLIIEAPKGTNCYVPKNRKESECILSDMTQLFVKSAEFDPTRNKFVVTMRYMGVDR